MNHTKNKAVIQRLLTETRTIAVVGLTDRPERAGHYVPAYLQQQGYRIIPVNPKLQQALGERAYPDLQAVPEPVDLVLIFRRPEDVLPVVQQAIATGAPAVWLQTGIINEDAAEEALLAGLDVVMDMCMLVEHRRWRARASRQETDSPGPVRKGSAQSNGDSPAED